MSGQGDDEHHVPVPVPAPDPAPAVPLETALVQRTFENQHRSVVRILAKGGSQVALGTGFVVHHDGTTCLVLTCHHTFESFSPCDLKVSVNFHDMADDVSVQVLRSIENRDLTLLRVPKVVPYYPPVEFSDEADLSGREVVMLGFFAVDSESMLVDPGASYGRIMSEPVVKQAEPLFECISSNYTADSGTSGGPVFMEDKVVGVNIEVDIGKDIALSAATVKSVLKSWTSRDNDPNITIPEMLQLIASEA